MNNFLQILKYLYYRKNGVCDHERLWKTSAGYCYVCIEEIPQERGIRLLEILGKIKRAPNENKN